MTPSEERRFRTGDAALVERLRDFVRIPSLATRPGSTSSAAGWVEERLREIGFRVWRRGPAHAPAIVAELAGRADRWLLFYNHYDVTDPGPLSGWSTDPFSAELRERTLFGRGVSDHKASFVARIEAIARLLQEGPLPVGVRFLVEGEEEVGSPHLESLLREHAGELAAHGGIYSGGALDEMDRPVIRAGSKGICSLRLSVRTLRGPMHSKWAAIAPNPAWRLIQALTGMIDLRTGRVLVEGFYDDVDPTSPEEREALAKASFDTGAFAEATGLRRFVGEGSEADVLHRLMFSPTFNLAHFTAGTGGRTVLPDVASAILDVRLVPWQRSVVIARSIREHLDRQGFDDVETELVGSGDPDKSSLGDPVVTSLERASRAVYASEPQVHPSGAGSGPRYLFKRHLGISLVQDPGASWFGSNDHGPDENVRLDDLLANVRLVERFLKEYGQSAR